MTCPTDLIISKNKGKNIIIEVMIKNASYSAKSLTTHRQGRKKKTNQDLPKYFTHWEVKIKAIILKKKKPILKHIHKAS